MSVTIRQFREEDISRKVEWINNPENNQFLHYDIPLDVEKTRAWFFANQGRTDRYDAVIEADGVPVGTIGLLSIDPKNRKAEYYIAMGEPAWKGRGVARQASRLILRYGFEQLGLERIYLFTETGNIPAQKLFEKAGFVREGCLRSDLFSHGKFVDRYAYSIVRKDWECSQ